MSKDDVPVEEESSADEVPAYIVTFSDMVTLLLTFFVMLLSLADMRDPELLNKGRDSFVESLQHCGMGVFMGKRMMPGLNQRKEKHMVPEEDPNAQRTIDAENEIRRRAFKRLDRTMATMPSQISASRADFSHIPGLGFQGNTATLQQGSQTVLAQYLASLRGTLAGRQSTIYVLGLAQDAGNQQQCWTLAGQRAQVVSDLIDQQLNSGHMGSEIRVYAWGAGPGYRWAGRKGPIASDAQILVAVLKNR